MKKLALVILAGISFATVNAQFQFGVKGGANFANLTGSGATGAQTLLGLNAGIYARLPLAEHLGIQPELVYSGQGAKYDQNGITLTQRSNYFNIPVLLKYSTGVGFFLETGPQLGFLMTAKLNVESNSQDVKNGYTSTDLSWVFGAGYKIPATRFSIDLRYNLGISNIVNQDMSSETAHNGVFQLGVMYTLFSTGRK